MTAHPFRDDSEPRLSSKLAFLREPRNYPDAPAQVEAIETHFSWVFLTERHAYKLKKPVFEPMIDWRTLAARHRNCDEETRVNRRFAPDVYLGVVALVRDDAGDLRLEGEGRAVEWLVKMRRLPAAVMLDRLIVEGGFDAARLAPVVDLLCRVYAGSPAPMPPAAYLDHLAQIIETSSAELTRPEFGLGSALIAELAAAQRELIQSRWAAFEARAARVVEGHGDLRPEHVCLIEPPRVIDSLEFARVLRLVDPVDELGFLALECERLGAPAARATIFAEYTRASGHSLCAWLIDFYQSVRAGVRARLAMRHLLEPNPRDPERWPRLARRYLELATSHVAAAGTRGDRS